MTKNINFLWIIQMNAEMLDMICLKFFLKYYVFKKYFKFKVFLKYYAHQQTNG